MEADLPELPEDDALPKHPYKQWIIVPGDPSDESRCPAWAWELHACLELANSRLNPVKIPHSIVWRLLSAFEFLNCGVDPECQLPHKDFFLHAVASERAIMLGTTLYRYTAAFWKRYTRERKEVDILQNLLHVVDGTVRMSATPTIFVPWSYPRGGSQ
jgi:hypothetical protein